MSTFRIIGFVWALFCPLFAQPRYTFQPNKAYKLALQNGTRATDGVGNAYFQNQAQYRITARLNPQTHFLEGEQTVQVTNQSPIEWRSLYFHVRQNIYKENAVRNRFAPATGGMVIEKVSVGGRNIVPQINGTVMQITPFVSLKSGESITLEMKWRFKLPEKSFRMGYDEKVHFAAYWYPQLAVFDDVQGWDTEQYLGNGEFYMGWANYSVSLSVPSDYVVASTGMLQNGKAIFKPDFLRKTEQLGETPQRLMQAGEKITSANGWINWQFQAENVRDFAFGISKHWVWDAQKINLNGKWIQLNSLYDPSAQHWDKSLLFLRQSVNHLSQNLVDYPYPQMTTCQGFLGGGMEFPQLIFVGSPASERSLFAVTYHEVAHQWFPMMVGSDENSFAWMDEGLANYLENEAVNQFYPNEPNAWYSSISAWHQVSINGREVPMMQHTDTVLPFEGARYVAAYDKLGLILRYSDSLFDGNEVQENLRRYTTTWAFKHPYPYDFINMMMPKNPEISALFDATDAFDVEVLPMEEASTVRIRSKASLVPSKLFYELQFQNGTTQRGSISNWVVNGTNTESLLKLPPNVQKIQLDPDLYLLETERNNNSLTF